MFWGNNGEERHCSRQYTCDTGFHLQYCQELHSQLNHWFPSRLSALLIPTGLSYILSHYQEVTVLMLAYEAISLTQICEATLIMHIHEAQTQCICSLTLVRQQFSIHAFMLHGRQLQCSQYACTGMYTIKVRLPKSLVTTPRVKGTCRLVYIMGQPLFWQKAEEQSKEWHNAELVCFRKPSSGWWDISLT